MSRLRFGAAMAGLVLLSVGAAACSAPSAPEAASSSAASSGEGSTPASSSAAAPDAPSPDVSPSPDAPDSPVVPTAAPSPTADVTTINGEVPPGTVASVKKSEILLDAYDDSLEHLVFRDTRPPGTRSPIHEHPYGGTTCVLEGQMTLYLEGLDPQVADPGECYWMPPGRPMTGVSSGSVDAVMMDNFAVPPGQPVWWVVEPGTDDITDHNFAPVPHM